MPRIWYARNKREGGHKPGLCEYVFSPFELEKHIDDEGNVIWQEDFQVRGEIVLCPTPMNFYLSPEQRLNPGEGPVEIDLNFGAELTEWYTGGEPES